MEEEIISEEEYKKLPRTTRYEYPKLMKLIKILKSEGLIEETPRGVIFKDNNRKIKSILREIARLKWNWDDPEKKKWLLTYVKRFAYWDLERVKEYIRKQKDPNNPFIQIGTRTSLWKVHIQKLKKEVSWLYYWNHYQELQEVASQLEDLLEETKRSIRILEEKSETDTKSLEKERKMKMLEEIWMFFDVKAQQEGEKYVFKIRYEESGRTAKFYPSKVDVFGYRAGAIHGTLETPEGEKKQVIVYFAGPHTWIEEDTVSHSSKFGRKKSR